MAVSAYPIFPEFYYADSMTIDIWARQAIEARERGEVPPVIGAPGHRLQVALLTSVYAVFGHAPLAAKILHAAAGAASCVLLAAVLAPLFGPACALASGSLLAAWPSAVFGSSQIMKDPLVAVLAYAGLWALLPLLGREKIEGAVVRASAGAVVRASAGAVALALAGYFRSHVMLVLAASVAGGALWSLRNGGPRARVALAAALLSPALYLASSRLLFTRRLTAPAPGTDIMSTKVHLIPGTYDVTQTRYTRPLSPRGITEFRLLRLAEDRKWAAHHGKREIGTQIYPDARLDSWLDVAAFVPKAAFSVLFMPLPGLYPMDGKLGRLGAAGENVVLLLLTAAAAAGIRRLRLDPARAALLGIFACMTIGSALLEFDLGSATRHKAFYFPMLFPFASAAFLGPRRAPEAFR